MRNLAYVENVKRNKPINEKKTELLFRVKTTTLVDLRKLPRCKSKVNMPLIPAYICIKKPGVKSSVLLFFNFCSLERIKFESTLDTYKENKNTID